MSTEEKVILGLVFAALAAVIIFQRKELPQDKPTASVADIGTSLTPSNADMANGPAYLVANAPWFFMPPVNMALPTVTVGQGAQTVENPLGFVKRHVTTIFGKDRT